MIQIYTGNGKGKTTAAIGLAIRAIGAGKKVYFCQFIKGKPYSELELLHKIKKITCEQFGRGCFIKRPAQPKDCQLAQEGLAKLRLAIASNKYDMVIMDEINVALSLKLLDTKEVLAILKKAPRKTELVLTGRGCPQEIYDYADLISEVKEIKHYYRRGIKARKGIEY